MSGRVLHGGRPGRSYDDDWWASVHALYEECFPGLPAGIARAAAVGVDWAEPTTPFAWFEGDRCVAHVGVVTHPVRLAGAVVPFAGIHAVCTASDRRMQGLCRELMQTALAWADRTHAVAKLSTDDPPVYAGHGFRTVPTHRFHGTLDAVDPGPVRSLLLASDPQDAARVRSLLARRTWASERFATAEDGWLVLLDAALGNRLDQGWVYLEDHDCVVAYRTSDTGVLVQDVIAAVLPPGEVVVGALPAGKPVFWAFAPDRFDPDARAEEVDRVAAGHFMVRGALPVGLGPFGISGLWEH